MNRWLFNGHGHLGPELALELTLWSRDIVLCTDGEPIADRKSLDRLGVAQK